MDNSTSTDIQNLKVENLKFSFFLHFIKNNEFDNIVDSTILKNEIELNKISSSINDPINDLKFIVEAVVLEHQLKVLSEMKIIYSYKSFEHNLRSLLKSMYKEYNESYYEWDKIKSFLKRKEIEMSEIDSYHKIDQLRRVNNAIKHSDISETKGINEFPEFRSKEIIKYNDVIEFYKRVGDSNVSFFNSLRNLILKNDL